jgi:hypothetical protein
MEKHFEYLGDLATTPLAEILATINRYRVPGVLTLTREGRIRKIFLDEGLVVFAASNEREVSLGMHLLRQGVLSPETAREADARVARDGLRLGQALLQMGILTPERLNQAIGQQVREILWRGFDWVEGEVLFEIGPRRLQEPFRIDLRIPDVILEGILRASDVRRLLHRLGSGKTLLERMQSPLIELFSPTEQEFYQKVDGRTPLQLLCTKGPGTAPENARLLYAFFCLGLLRRLAGTGGAKKIQYKTEGGTLAD